MNYPVIIRFSYSLLGKKTLANLICDIENKSAASAATT